MEGACYDVGLVLVTKSDSGIARVAEEHEIPVVVVDPNRESFGDEVVLALSTQRIDMLALAGFMKLLPTVVLTALDGHVVNIHPALLPKFGGAGMYGLRVHEAVLAAGEKVTGATVHWVTENYDEGAVIEQSKLQIRPGITAEKLQIEVKALEHVLFPRVLQMLAMRQATRV